MWHVVCGMKCGVALLNQPTITIPSLPYTNATCKKPPRLFCPMQPRNIGHTASLTASAVGDRSLMWAYHITGTPGCSTPKVDNQHSLG